MKDDVKAISGEGLVGYFGYGSLVNRATHRTEIIAAYPARLTGWRRYFRARPANAPRFGGIGPAVLGASACAGSAIDGLVVIDRIENLPSVDEREALYRRVLLAPSVLAYSGEKPPFDCPVYVYEPDYEAEAVDAASPILRSYLDAVLQGFHREFGPEGVARFIAETEGLDGLIHEDRQAPVYPRSVQLSKDEESLFLDLLVAAGNLGA